MTVDRLAPTRRPHVPSDGTQRWRDLLFTHWEVPAETLRPHVPTELQIDSFDGRAFVGVVPFKMRRVQPRGLPAVLAPNFLETNVRTYVVHNGRPGVYFFSLDASSRLAVWAARWGWSLPYFYARMQAQQDGQQRTYESHRPGGGAQHRVSFRIGQEIGLSTPGTLEHFLLERYLLYVEHEKRIHLGQVHHSAYPAFTAVVDEIDDQLLPAAGLPQMSRPPDLVHFSPGVDVEVFGIRPA